VTDHVTVRPPTGVVPARFRPPAGASDARTVSLDGPWRFRLHPTARTGADPRDPGDGWDTLAVPGHWQLAQAPDAWPYGTPAYSNALFPFPIDPPFVPDENPTGEYRRTIELPEDWPADGRTYLRFEGVDSWFEVAVNGAVLATSHGSRLPTEIDVTDALRPGQNLLAVRVTQWSAYSYVEDQDQWWLSGIFRSVTLEHRPAAGLRHVGITAGYDHTTAPAPCASTSRTPPPAPASPSRSSASTWRRGRPRRRRSTRGAPSGPGSTRSSSPRPVSA